MARKRGILTLSMSVLKQYLGFCPHSVYIEHVETKDKKKVPQKTDYPRLCGRQVHYFVASLYKKHRGDRKFLYKSMSSARKAWMYSWKKAQVKEKDKIIKPNESDADKHAAIGWKCIENYWTTNINRPKPLFIEKRFTIPWEKGVEFTGVVDQIRPLTLEAIKEIRPEVIENGVLSDKFAPVLVVDLKTGYAEYDAEDNEDGESLLRKQYELLYDIQASAYALLYKKYYGKFPIGFLMYRLRDNRVFLVKGDLDSSQQILKDTMAHVIKNIRDGSYPKNTGKSCRRCDFIKECLGTDEFVPAIPREMPQSPENPNKIEELIQLKFKLKYKKEKR